MTDKFDIQAVKARRETIAKELERLTAEDRELEAAVRVFERFSPRPNGKGATGKLGPPRPEGTPSLFDMTVTVLRDAISTGKSGLRNREIVKAIGDKYWPGVQPRQVLPPIYA